MKCWDILYTYVCIVALYCIFFNCCSDVNELLIRNESESSGGSLTDKVEELLKGELYISFEYLFKYFIAQCAMCVCTCMFTCGHVYYANNMLNLTPFKQSSMLILSSPPPLSPSLPHTHVHTVAATDAVEVFDGIIKCKKRADQTRNALTVLEKHRFLFSLPRSIEKNIKNVSIIVL